MFLCDILYVDVIPSISEMWKFEGDVSSPRTDPLKSKEKQQFIDSALMSPKKYIEKSDEGLEV